MKILIVSEKRDKFYDLTEIIPEMMEVEKMTEQECVDYFMDGLEGTRYMKFPAGTPNKVVTQWITSDMGLDWYGDTNGNH